MKLVDVNLLLYAVDESSPNHERARGWLEASLSAAGTFAFAWSVLLAFVRIATNPRAFTAPLGVDTSFDVVDRWLARPQATIVQPTARHARVVRELLGPLGTAGNLVPDAHLAALAIEHGAELYSADADFSRFPRVRWVNPLRA